ncbi:MAG: hypothetical protein M3Y44_00270 [Actinomycetota bacterium]|nr:hypothetical protein [Actinomycetota bacterium]
MSKFLLIYRAPKGYAPNAGTPDAWGSWFVAIGSNIVDPGDQVFVRDAVGPVVADSTLAGYSVIVADDLPEAVSLANGCPGVEDGFTVEIGELASAS